MTSYSPDHRFLLVNSSGPREVFADENLARLHRYLYLGTDDPLLKEAHHLYISDYCKGSLNSFLLLPNSLGEISEITEVDLKVLEIYEYYFFDRSCFTNRLLKMSWVVDQTCNSPLEEAMKLAREHGLKLGFNYLAWKLTGKVIHEDKVKLKNSILADAVWLYREAVLNGQSVDAAKLLQALVKLLEDNSKLDPVKIKELFDSFKLKIVNLDTTNKLNEGDSLPDGVRELLLPGEKK